MDVFPATTRGYNHFLPFTSTATKRPFDENSEANVSSSNVGRARLRSSGRISYLMEYFPGAPDPGWALRAHPGGAARSALRRHHDTDRLAVAERGSLDQGVKER